MAVKFVPTAALITLGATTLYGINIEVDESAGEVDVTDGSTTGNGRDFLAGRQATAVTFDAFIIDTVATPVTGAATGAIVVKAKDGVTDKAFSWLSGVIISKRMKFGVSADEAAMYSLEIRADGAVTESQFS